MAVDADGPADGVRICPELLLPAGVADDGDRVRSGAQVVGGFEEASAEGWYAHQMKIVTRNLVSPETRVTGSSA